MIPIPVIQVWDEDGSTALGNLSGVIDLTVSDVLNDCGSIQFTVPRDVSGAEYLDVDADRQVAVHMSDVSSPMWFVVDDDASSWVSDDPLSEPIQVTGRSLHALLDEAVVIPSGGIGTTPAEWAWSAQTPGKIVTDLVTSAQSRGLLQGITVSGDATNDASSVAWGVTVTVTHKAGTTLLSVCRALAQAGLMDYRFNGRVLELHRPSGAMDTDVDVVMRPRRDVVASPLSRSRRGIATAVVIEGDSEATARRTQTLSGRREREVYVSESKAASGTLNAIADLYLAAHDESDVQYTHELTDGDDSPVPWVDYSPGDNVMTLAAGQSVVRRRVFQVALTMSDPGSTVTVEMGSILRTAEEQMKAKLDRLLPGEGVVT